MGRTIDSLRLRLVSHKKAGAAASATAEQKAISAAASWDHPVSLALTLDPSVAEDPILFCSNAIRA